MLLPKGYLLAYQRGMNEYKVAAFYHFTPLADLGAWRTRLRRMAAANGICGSILIAAEGINATIAGLPQGLDRFMQDLLACPELQAMEVKYSTASEKPFKRMKVRPKKEIIRYDQPQADPHQQVGIYVEPKDWNALISDPDVVVVDTRNQYETMLGIFQGAIDPNTQFFTQLPDWVHKHLDPKKHKKVAMYCTGGIRCEKSTSHMLAEGFDEVYHLKGGILKYLEDIPEEESLWQGECFVFDERVALTHGLKEGKSRICYGCGHPLYPDDLKHAHYRYGICCHHCAEELTPEREQKLQDRHQEMIARKTA